MTKSIRVKKTLGKFNSMSSREQRAFLNLISKKELQVDLRPPTNPTNSLERRK